jgi:hypothetical protein
LARPGKLSRKGLEIQARLRNENYGFTSGAPILRNKTFFFIGFEKQDYIFGLTGLTTEPSAVWAQSAQSLLAKYDVPQSSLSTTLLSTLWPSSITSLPRASRSTCSSLGRSFSSSPGRNCGCENTIGKQSSDPQIVRRCRHRSVDAVICGQPLRDFSGEDRVVPVTLNEEPRPRHRV